MTILLAILFLITIAASVCASYLYGLTKLQAKMIVEGKRREKRLHNSLNLWQNVYVKSKGGALKEQPPKNTEQKPARKIVSPSEVIAELKEPKIQVKPVPQAIEAEFMESVKPYASTNTDNTR
jgi:hypothetical protein